MACRLASIGLRTSSIAVLLLLWWAASALVNDPEVLPGPSSIARTIIKDFNTTGPEGESAYFDIGITLARIFVAFLASMVGRHRHRLGDGPQPALRALAAGTDPVDADDADDPHGFPGHHVVRL